VNRGSMGKSIAMAMATTVDRMMENNI